MGFNVSGIICKGPCIQWHAKFDVNMHHQQFQSRCRKYDFPQDPVFTKVSTFPTNMPPGGNKMTNDEIGSSYHSYQVSKHLHL